MHARHNAAFTALLAAALFGATTPLAKTLLGSLSPLMVAGQFYLGSGAGLAFGILFQRFRRTAGEREYEGRIQLAEVPWLLGAIAAGGIAGPALLIVGLSTTPAATSSLLLNLEGVFTAVIAWVVFHETSTCRYSSGWWPSWPAASRYPGNPGQRACLRVRYWSSQPVFPKRSTTT
jgi:drug/metabolite transporter (DMT)-like permease